jgi:phosphatidylserine/phosphatidylglycerophosphate/cardiolipin synthase-like enzyme
MENQYFSSEEIRAALVERMRHRGGVGAGGGEPLEIAIVLPQQSAGLKEQVAIGVRQSEILRQLEAVALQTGHHVGVYYSAAPGEEGDVPVFIHAKVLAVDDRFLLVSSANATNRSMGLDSELGLAWESDVVEPTIRDARIELLREHCGLSLDEARPLLAEEAGLVARLDALARARSHRLRLHAMCEDAEPGCSIAHALREDVPLDPDAPVFEDIFPEPDSWRRHLRERAKMAVQRARIALRRRPSRGQGRTSQRSRAMPRG